MPDAGPHIEKPRACVLPFGPDARQATSTHVLSSDARAAWVSTCLEGIKHKRPRTVPKGKNHKMFKCKTYTSRIPRDDLTVQGTADPT